MGWANRGQLAIKGRHGHQASIHSGLLARYEELWTPTVCLRIRTGCVGAVLPSVPVTTERNMEDDECPKHPSYLPLSCYLPSTLQPRNHSTTPAATATTSLVDIHLFYFMFFRNIMILVFHAPEYHLVNIACRLMV